jgi:hypothetical protein
MGNFSAALRSPFNFVGDFQDEGAHCDCGGMDGIVGRSVVWSGRTALLLLLLVSIN